jgi:hypothetical protein
VADQPPQGSRRIASAATTATPSIGVFWLVQGNAQLPVLLADLCPVGSGEPYDDFLTYGGHYDHWDKLAALGAGELGRRGLPTAPVWSEYEEWPRGRVVYHVPTERFILYADRQLQQPETLNLIIHRFGLPQDRYEVRSDRHYVSTRKIRLR